MNEKDLGEGTYGQVRSVNGIAVKKFSDTSRLIQEYCALLKLENCNNVVDHKFIDIEKNEMGMELYDMDLSEWINKNPKENKKFLKLFKGFLKGLIFIHCKNLVHADVKPGNVLVDSKKLKCVVADCGFVSKVPNQKCKLTASRYRDPIFLGLKSHDMYSCGIILIEYFGKLRRLKIFKKMNNLINYKVKSESFKQELFKLIEISKNEDKNVYKVFLRLSEEYKKNIIKVPDFEKANYEKKIELINNIVDICKREEYVKVMESADSIPDKKLSKIAKNLVQPYHSKRMNCIELYQKLYGEKCKKYKRHDSIVDYDYKEEFVHYISNRIKELINNRIHSTKTDSEEFNLDFIRKKPNKFWDNFNEDDYYKISISIRNLNVSEINNIDMIAIFYIFCCIYKRSIVTEVNYIILRSECKNLKHMNSIIKKLLSNKKFVYSLY